jgi:hypothetical protein
MIRSLASLVLAGAAAASAQYKYEAAGAPPPEVPPAIAATLQEKGHRVLSADGKPWCEVWFVKAPSTGPATGEAEVTWKTIVPWSVVGAIRWPAPGYDRRGQIIKPGVYTLRYGNYPINGDHLGVAPQRDFLVMTPVDADKDAKPLAKFDDLMAMSKKVSGAAHPAVLSMWLIESNFQPGLSQAGEHDWALQAEVGGAKIGLILVGKAE